MTNRERFLSVLNFRKPDDRLPLIEWASWWDKTLLRWYGEGLDPSLAGDDLYRHFGLDALRQYWFPCLDERCPKPARCGGPLIENEADYDALKPLLYSGHGIDAMIEDMRSIKARHDAGEVVIWFSMDGAFWFPRTLLGIESHLFAFYDQPELYHRIINDLADFELRQAAKIFSVCIPDFMTIAEDMSYNNGPMLSESCFRTFLAPYYEKVVPFIKSHGTKVFVDTDGDVTLMIPWLRRAGIDGVLPLERMSGVDIAQLRKQYPDLLLLGAFDKTVMKYGEADMRREFERILPVMRSGGYIPGVDHQTPPDVSMNNYRLFIRLLREYCAKAVV